MLTLRTATSPATREGMTLPELSRVNTRRHLDLNQAAYAGNTAIVLAAGINGLGVARILSRAGVRVIACYFDASDPIRYSSAPERKHFVPDIDDHEALVALLARYGGEQAVVMSCSDMHADFLSRYRDRLERLGLVIAGPPGTLAEMLNDKAVELDLVRGLNVKVPRSVARISHDPDELLAALRMPIIIKPRSHLHLALISGKNVVARTRRDVEHFLQEHRAVLDGFVAQEIVEGPDEALWVCNCCFGTDSELLTAFTFQRIRTSPAHFGVTSFAVGRNNQAIKKLCTVIGKQLAYVGPAMFEFKYDADDDTYCYLEINPRFGMCDAFSSLSGVNNALTAFHVAQGGDPEPCPERQVDGVVFLNLYADLYARYVDGEPIGAVLRSYWATRRAPHSWAFFDASDPRPFLHALWKSAGYTVRALGRKVSRALLPGPRRGGT
jgi:D-aspartate ligase